MIKSFTTTSHLASLIFCVWSLQDAPTGLYAQEPTAASLAFTSQDSVVLKALELLNSGQFKAAEDSLIDSPTPPGNPQMASESLRAREELRDLIDRIRYEYSLSPEGLLAKIKKIVPDATEQDVQQWAAETPARFRMIDGDKFYFRREPQNIFLFSPTAKKRRALNSGPTPKPTWQLTDHLNEIVAQAESSGQTEVMPIEHRITHTLTIHPNNPDIKPDSIVRVWLPLAQEYRQQRQVKLLSTSPEPTLIAPSAVDGNPISSGAQRTVYFEHKVIDPAMPLVFKVEFEYTSYAYYPKLVESEVQPLPENWNGAYLDQRLPHIVYDPQIRAQVATIVGDETNPLIKARKIFRWVSANVPWNAEDEYCTIPSFALRGFHARRGDCGVQNTLFITMCRLAGIPARWQSGFETKPGENWGMHDWAEIYIAPWGWLPADASYGVQPSSDPRVADFYCGHQDSYRLIVNLDWGRDLLPSKNTLRSEPADFQRGEVEVDGKNLYYDKWQAKTERSTTPVVTKP